MVKEGLIDLRQDRAFAPLVGSAQGGDAAGAGGGVIMADEQNALFDLKAAGRRSRMSPAQNPTRRSAKCMRLCEALIFAATEPLSEEEMAKRLPEGADLAAALAFLKADYFSRGVNLARVGKKWFFRTAPDLAWVLQRERVEPRKAFARRYGDPVDRRLSPARRPAPKSRIFAAWPCPRARWTCCWRPAGCACAAAAARRDGP